MKKDKDLDKSEYCIIIDFKKNSKYGNKQFARYCKSNDKIKFWVNSHIDEKVFDER